MKYCYCLSASLKCTFSALKKGSCVPHLFSIEIRCCFLKHEFMKKRTKRRRRRSEGNEKTKKKQNKCESKASNKCLSVNHN